MATKRINSKAKGGIYLILCKNSDKVYVGSSKDFGYRWEQHLLKLRNGAHHNNVLQNAFNKYGESSFEFAPIIELGEYDRSVYFEEENRVISEMQSEGVKLFNLAHAGGGWSKSIEQLDPQKYIQICSNISSGIRKFIDSLTDEQRCMLYGRKGVPLTDERKEHLSNFWKGKKKSPETRSKMSESQKKISCSDGRAERFSEIGKLNKGKLPPNSVRLIIGDMEFGSIKDAAKHLGVGYFSLLSVVKPDKYIQHAKYVTERERLIFQQFSELKVL